MEATIKTIHKAIKLRLYPTAEQKRLLATNFGHGRFVYNQFLRMKTDSYAETGKGVSYLKCSALLTQLKKQEGTEWLSDANSQCLQQKLRDLDGAFEKFFTRKSRYPRYKSKRDVQSIRFPQNVSIRNGRLWLPTLFSTKTRGQLPDPSIRIGHATVSQQHGKYFVSLSVEVPAPQPFEPNGRTIGIDLGLSVFLTTSDGLKVENPRFLRKAQRRLRRTQRSHSRKTKGSNNRAKARIKLSQQHEKVTNKRKDFHHKLSLQLLRENQTIVLEDLCIKGMARTRLAKSVHDVGWGNFVRMLEYKAIWYGREIRKVDRFYPSSKRCNKCGSIKQDLKLRDRTWTCRECSAVHDRDINAAINIRKFNTAGLAGINAQGDSALAGSMN